MNLKDKMDLRILAINALYTYIDEFSLEDDDYIDYRAVRGKEIALNNRIKKMSEMTGVDEEKIYHIVVNSIPTSTDKYFNELRDIGIPVLTDEEIDAYEKSKYKEEKIMDKYTEDDLISYPNEKTKLYIGKECYFNNNPNDCLKHANTDNPFFVGILQFINPNNTYPFYFGRKDELTAYSCIIPKKEPEYVPFSNKEEFLSAYEEHTKSMKKYGIWIFNNINGIDYRISCLITEIWNDGIVIGSSMGRTLWKYLLESFVFEDGTPCGKENNNA